jgi:hypothetical protein
MTNNTPSHDPLAVDKVALRASQAGMRFIAQMTIYNSANWERLTRFIAESYHPAQLEEQPVESRLQMFQTTFERIGRMKVKQVIATNEHHVIIVLEVEKMPDLFYLETKVEEEYPHRIVAYMHAPLRPSGS